MTVLESFDAGVAHQLGLYADAVRVPAGWDQILVSGTPGLAPDGTLPAARVHRGDRGDRRRSRRAGAGLVSLARVGRAVAARANCAAVAA